jgi:hypothetical protein
MCEIPPELRRWGLAVDRIYPETTVVGLTHAHQDHWSFLTPTLFRTRPTLRVVCSTLTRDLVFCVKPTWATRYAHHFVTVELRPAEERHQKLHWFSWTAGIWMGVAPSDHCPGSILFVFCVAVSGLKPQRRHGRKAERKMRSVVLEDRVVENHMLENHMPPTDFDTSHWYTALYTGDFRWLPGSTLSLSPLQHLRALFLDDSLLSFDLHCPTFDQVRHMIARVQSQYPHIYVNLSVLGLELLLQRSCAEQTQAEQTNTPLTRAWIHPSLQHTARGAQVALLLAPYLSTCADQASLWLYHRDRVTEAHRQEAQGRDLDPSVPRLLCSVTQFLCHQWNTSQEHYVAETHTYYVCFSGHATRSELQAFQQHLPLSAHSRVATCQQELGSTLMCRTA